MNFRIPFHQGKHLPLRGCNLETSPQSQGKKGSFVPMEESRGGNLKDVRKKNSSFFVKQKKEKGELSHFQLPLEEQGKGGVEPKVLEGERRAEMTLLFMGDKKEVFHRSLKRFEAC